MLMKRRNKKDLDTKSEQFSKYTDEDAPGLVEYAAAAGRVVDASEQDVAGGVWVHVGRHKPSQPHLLP